jgi:hypothetical protein
VANALGRIGKTMRRKKRIDGAAKQKSMGADLPFNIYHVDLIFFQINLDLKQRQIFNKMQNLIGKFK